jgi:hypothetical protein
MVASSIRAVLRCIAARRPRLRRFALFPAPIATPRDSKRRPRAQGRRRDQTRRARLPSVHLVCRGRRTMVSTCRRSCGHSSPATARLPRLVARGYLAAVYGPSVRDSFLLGSQRFGKPSSVIDSLSESIGGLLCRAAPARCASPAVTERDAVPVFVRNLARWAEILFTTRRRANTAKQPTPKECVQLLGASRRMDLRSGSIVMNHAAFGFC